MRSALAKLFILMTALAALLTLSACDDESPEDKAQDSGGLMYKFDYIDDEFLPASERENMSDYLTLRLDEVSGGDSFRGVKISANNITYDRESGTVFRFYGSNVKPKHDGDVFKEFEAEIPGVGGYYMFYLMPGSDNRNQAETVFMRTDTEGNTLWTKPIGEMHENFSTDFSKLMVDSEGYIYNKLNLTDNEQNIAVFSPDGELMFVFGYPEDCIQLQGRYLNCELARDADGRVLLQYRAETGGKIEIYSFAGFDLEGGCYTPLTDIPTVEYINEKVTDQTRIRTYFYTNTPVFGGGSYDVYYYNRNGLYGVRKDEEPEQLFSWLEVGLSLDVIMNMSIVSEEEIVLYIIETPGSGFDANDLRYGRIRRVPIASVYGEGVEEVPVLRVAIDRDNNPYLSTILNYAGAFIRSGGGCQVELVSYSDTEGGLSANQKLAQDIAKNKAPDIVLFGGGLNYEVLSGSNMFLDLYPLMGSSDNLNREDFLPCVLKPFENSRGELDRMITEFTLMTMVGNRKYVGDEPGWSYADFAALNDTLTDEQYLFGVNDTKQPELSMLEAMLPLMLGEFIDYNAKTCDFDGIRELLELCVNTKKGANLYLDPNLTANDIMLLHQSNYTNIDYFVADRYANFAAGEGVAVGYPTVDGSGSGTYVNPVTCMSIPKHSGKPELAWKLIEFCIGRKDAAIEKSVIKNEHGATDNFRQLSNFTCTRLGMEKWLEYAIEREYIIEVRPMDGRPEIQLMTINSRLINEDNPVIKTSGMIVQMSSDDAKALMKLLETADRAYITDPVITAIILEDASACFAGTKTIDEAVKLITDRVSTRIAE